MTFIDMTTDSGCLVIFGAGGSNRVNVESDFVAFHDVRTSAYVESLGKNKYRVTDVSFDAVESSFAAPLPSTPTPVANTIHIHGNVTGGTIAQGVDVTINGSDAAALLVALRQAAEGIQEGTDRALVLEQADNIDDELRSAAPKPSKVIAFLKSIPPAALKYAPVASAPAAIANAIHLPLPWERSSS